MQVVVYVSNNDAESYALNNKSRQTTRRLMPSSL